MNFYRVDHTVPGQGLTVTYRAIDCGEYPPEISVTRNGIQIQGDWPFLNEVEHEQFQQLLERCAAQRNRLSRYPRMFYSFESDPLFVTEHRKSLALSDTPETITVRKVLVKTA